MEKAFLKNILTNKNLTIKLNGHIPYGDPYQILQSEIFSINLFASHAPKDKVEELTRMFGRRVRTSTSCLLCGKRMTIIPRGNSKIEYIAHDYGEKHTIIDDPSLCELRDEKSQVHSVEINVPSGELMINNFFFKEVEGRRKYLFEVPEKEEYSPKYDLQSLKGRFNIMDYLSTTYNCGYGQMSNMSVEVFLSKDRKTVIIGSEPFEDGNKKDEKFNKEFESNYHKIGYICLDVWRWECADKETLKAAGHCGEAEVEAKVLPGRYVITHYFDSTKFEENNSRYNVYSEIKLKE